MAKTPTLTKRHATRMLTASVSDAILTLRNTAPHQRKAVVLDTAHRIARKERIEPATMDMFRLMVQLGMPDVPPPLSKRELRRREKELADELKSWMDLQDAQVAVARKKAQRKRSR